MKPVTDIPGIGPAMAMELARAGITSAESFAKTPPAALTELRGIGPLRAKTLLDAAQDLVGAAAAKTPGKKKKPAKKAKKAKAEAPKGKSAKKKAPKPDAKPKGKKKAKSKKKT